MGPLIVPNLVFCPPNPFENFRATSCAAKTMKIIDGKETAIISKPQKRTWLIGLQS